MDAQYTYPIQNVYSALQVGCPVDKVNRQWLSGIIKLGCLEQRLAVYIVTSPAVCCLFLAEHLFLSSLPAARKSC